MIVKLGMKAITDALHVAVLCGHVFLIYPAVALHDRQEACHRSVPCA